MAETDATLSEVGEREIIQRIFVPRYGGQGTDFGDDCARVASKGVADGSVILATTDPAPRAVAPLVGFSDPYHQGWLLAAANLSDMAAAGATPLALLTSLTLPPDTRISYLSRLLDGVDACCASVGTKVIGGNLRDAHTTELVATAIGFCQGPPPLSRSGAEPGDVVCIVGESGLFWSAVLGLLQGVVSAHPRADALFSNLLEPRPLVAAGIALRTAGGVSACLDNSDGLYPSLLALAEANDLRVDVSLRGLCMRPEVTQICGRLGILPARLALGWGDWQLVAAVRPDRVAALSLAVAEHDVRMQPIGTITRGTGVNLDVDDGETSLDSERFAASSWLLHGLESYVERLVGGFPLRQDRCRLPSRVFV